MQPSRIAKDLMASGMDSSIHLAIAQESLRSLQDAVRDLPVILRDHDELLPLLLQQSFEIIGEKEYESLVKDIYSMQEAVKHAPRTIAQLQVDVRIFLFSVAEGEVEADGDR